MAKYKAVPKDKPFKTNKLGKKDISPATGRKFTISELKARKGLKYTCMHLKDMKENKNADYRISMGYVKSEKKEETKPVVKGIPLHMIDTKAYMKYCRDNNIQ